MGNLAGSDPDTSERWSFLPVRRLHMPSSRARKVAPLELAALPKQANILRSFYGRHARAGITCAKFGTSFRTRQLAPIGAKYWTSKVTHETGRFARAVVTLSKVNGCLDACWRLRIASIHARVVLDVKDYHRNSYAMPFIEDTIKDRSARVGDDLCRHKPRYP